MSTTTTPETAKKNGSRPAKNPNRSKRTEPAASVSQSDIITEPDVHPETSEESGDNTNSHDETISDTVTDQIAVQEVAETKETENLAVSLTPELIVQYATEAKMEFFQDQHGSVFAWTQVTVGEKKHWECLPIRSRGLLARLLELIKSRTESMPQLSTLKQAIEVLELSAYLTSKKNLENRRTTVGHETFIDLGDEDWTMVRIASEGWKVIDQDKPRFFRPKHMLALPRPQIGGSLDELFNFVPTETEGDKLLLIAWLLAGLYADIPNPILLLVGQQGSAKTTRSRRLRSLLDPSITPVLGDLEMSNLFQTFQHHAVPCFENVSNFKRREADIFCRAVTGNGVERRKLYTDSDQVLYSFRRAIIINGIDTPSTRPDFLDRCITINCRRMDTFITLDELDRQFEAARPRIFGAMLDVLAKALKVYSNMAGASEFRMADFARFGRAVSIALGQQSEDFDKAYRLNIEQRDCEILEDAPMGRLLEHFAAKYKGDKPWKGTAEELLLKLKEAAHVLNDVDARSDLPKSARWLSSRLGELGPALAARQVYITKLKRTNAKRQWQISSTIIPDPNAEPDSIFDVLGEADDQEQIA